MWADLMSIVGDSAWHILLGIGSILVAGLRITMRRRSGKQSLPSRLWKWWTILSDRERVIFDQQTDNERLLRRLSAQNSLIKLLQDDLDVASGIASSHELHNGEAHHWPSGEPTTSSHTPFSDTTKLPAPPDASHLMGDRRSGKDRRSGWGRFQK